MYRIIIFLHVAFAILASGADSHAPGVVAQQANARRELRDCIFDIVLSDVPTRKCKTKKDFLNMTNKYIELEDKLNITNVKLNKQYTEILLYTISHPNVRDFFKHYNCVNTTDCEIKEYGLMVDLNKNNSHKITNRTNIINQLFSASQEPQYNERKCDRNKSMLKCVERESLQKCDNNTKTFVLDIYKFSIKPCDNIKPKDVPGSASERFPTTFLMSLILTVLYLIR